MILLPVLTLAAGLSMATPAVSPPHHAHQAQARLDRLVAKAEPALRAYSLQMALDRDHRALQTKIATGVAVPYAAVEPFISAPALPTPSRGRDLQF